MQHEIERANLVDANLNILDRRSRESRSLSPQFVKSGGQRKNVECAVFSSGGFSLEFGSTAKNGNFGASDAGSLFISHFPS